MSETCVLIIDDDNNLRKLMVYQVGKAGFKIAEADTVKSALIVLENQAINVVLTDVHLPDGNGVELTKTIKAAYPLVEVIAITAEGKISDGVQAIKNGAFDYLVKGEEDSSRLIELLTSAAEKNGVHSRILALEKQINDHNGAADRSDIISQNLEQIEKATQIIKAIHSPLRQQIMQLIFKKGEATVTEIYTQLHIEQAVASQHLGILKNAGLVNSHREGKNAMYVANYSGIEKIIVFVQQLLA